MNRPRAELIRSCLTFLVAMQIVLNPFPEITAVHEISFYLSFLLFAILLYKRDLPFSLKNPLFIPTALFVVWSVAGLFFALNLQNSLHDVYAHLLKYLFIFYLTIHLMRDEKRFVTLIWGIVVTTAIFAIEEMVTFYIVIGKSFHVNLFSETPNAVAGNIIALLALFATILCIYLLTQTTSWRHKSVLGICMALLIITVLATQSRSALLAMAVSFVMAFRKNKKVILCLVLVSVLFITLMPVKNRLSPGAIWEKLGTDDRISIWYSYWEIIKDHPVIGVGFGMQTFYDDAFLKKYNDRVPKAYRNKNVYYAPHNTLVDLAARTGIVGLAFFLGIMAAFVRICLRIGYRSRDAFRRHWASCMLAAFTAVFIQGLFENTMSGPPAIVLYTIFAFGVILWNMERAA